VVISPMKNASKTAKSSVFTRQRSPVQIRASPFVTIAAKMIAFAGFVVALLGVFKNIEKVQEVFHVTEEAHQVLPIPKISWSLHKTKLDLLRMLSKGVNDIDVLKDELDVSRTMT
jgi:hypothetical protein